MTHADHLAEKVSELMKLTAPATLAQVSETYTSLLGLVASMAKTIGHVADRIESLERRLDGAKGSARS
jgi:hypothetical protein